MQREHQDDNYRAPRAGYQGKGHIIYEDVQAFSFSQRLNRLRFACYSFTSTVIVALLSTLFVILSASVFSGQAATLAWAGFFITIGILWLLYSISLAVRRLHDMGKTGWLVFLLLTPLLSIPIILFNPAAETPLFLVSVFSPLFSLYLLVGEGDTGMNGHGTPNSSNSVLVIIFGGLCWLLSVLSLLLQVTYLIFQFANPAALEKYAGKLPESDIQQLQRVIENYRQATQ